MTLRIIGCIALFGFSILNSTSFARESLQARKQTTAVFWSVVIELDIVYSHCRNSVLCDQIATSRVDHSIKSVEYLKNKMSNFETVHRALKNIQNDIKSATPSAEIMPQIKNVKIAMLSNLNDIPLPSETPNFERGRKGYLDHCSSCHGIDGEGNGELASKLLLPIKSLRDQSLREVLTPLSAFSMIHYGIPGSEMSSYENRISKRLIWDIAFYVQSIRIRESQMHQCESKLTLRSLVELTDKQLEEKFGNTWDCKLDLVTHARLVSPFLTETSRIDQAGPNSNFLKPSIVPWFFTILFLYLYLYLTSRVK